MNDLKTSKKYPKRKMFYSGFDLIEYYVNSLFLKQKISAVYARRSGVFPKLLGNKENPLKCEICKKLVLEKMQYDERRFGLLENCPHVFCLTCIRKHRAGLQNTIISKKDGNNSKEHSPIPTACPVCKVESLYIMSSNIWFDDPNKKTRYLNLFKEETKDISCPWFKHGQGQCLYSKCAGHVLSEQRKEKIPEKADG
ncbi:E3 ubiquitin-protein ligase makorin-2-like [Argiope bruennichi]|uniref:Putative E3 ubiquitin-protein ligase like protein n=1 Tax=Argiope bruennichi TaxID=94029 RepID=A0A8T0E6B5_ARGBR|nr:E3 ubiquitin-protein ligase makorin-2-like [Argiope bruennichi]KAF8766927.1 putative E3 ubiquitin-protein ligase like protein [Argiope bruennichi]